MKKKLNVLLITISMIAMAFLSSVPQEVKATPEDPELQMWGVDFTWDPDPGFYKEDITFTGTAGCPDPVYWNWTFQPGSVKRYGNPVDYSWAPYWESPKYYQVLLTVTNGSGASAGRFKNAPVTITYDLTGSATASPVLATTGTWISFDIEAINLDTDDHFCPLDYDVDVDIFRVLGGKLEDCDELKGRIDLGYLDTEDLECQWYAWTRGMFRARIIFDTEFDEYTNNNVVWSNVFTII